MMKIWDKNRIGIYFFVVLFAALLIPSIIGHGQEPTDEPTALTVEEVLQEAQNENEEFASLARYIRSYFVNGEITADSIHQILTTPEKTEGKIYTTCIERIGKFESYTNEEFYLSEIKVDESDRFFYGSSATSCPIPSSEILLNDFLPILVFNSSVLNGYPESYEIPKLKAFLYAWGKLIEKKNPGVNIIDRLTLLSSARLPQAANESQVSPDSSQQQLGTEYALEGTASEDENLAEGTRIAETTIAVGVQETTAAMETAIEAARLAAAGTATATAATATEQARLAAAGTATATAAMATEAARLAAAETQIATAATATATARLEEEEKSKEQIIAISIALGVIGLGAAVFLFIFTQRKRKAAYQMRFEQRRINAVPAPHLFDVEPKARPASTMPSGVSAGGEGNFERSITIEPAEELSDSATMEIDMGSSSVLRYDFGNIQHQGSREYQEDSFGFSDVADPNLVASRGILAVLADGMGGLKNGKSISERTVAKFRKAFMSFTPGVEVPRQLYSLVHETNAEIYQTDKQKGGTTLICVYIYGNSMYWVSVGDSAIYLFRQGRMYQLNREHNRLNDLYLRFMYREITKAQLLAEPTLQGLTSNIGRKELRDVDQNLRELRLRRGDRILLCSDGVSGRLTEKEMLVAMSQGNAQKCTDALKNFVLKKKAPKQDNLTAQVISCD